MYIIYMYFFKAGLFFRSNLVIEVELHYGLRSVKISYFPDYFIFNIT